MTDIEVDLEKGLGADGWRRGPWRMALQFDKTNKNQMIKLKTDIHGNKRITATVEIKVR